MVTDDLYRKLFGRSGTTKGSDIDMSEQGRVGGVSTGQPFKFVQNIEPLPTDPSKLNGTEVLDYDVSGNLSTITKTISGIQYQQTLTWDGENLIGISAWVIL